LETNKKGHITYRDPVEPNTFWVNPFGTAFSLIKASDLIRVSEEGQIIEGGENRLLNAAAFAIVCTLYYHSQTQPSPATLPYVGTWVLTLCLQHSAIHQARPDVNAACHSHTIYGRAFCSLGRKLDTITQDACAFHNDHAVYESFNGIVLAAEEGRNIAACVGTKKAALLQNHGLLTVGRTIDEAVFWFVSMDKCCHAQLLAEAAAGPRGEKPIVISEEDAAFTYKTVGTHYAGYFSAKPLFDVIHKETGGDYLE
jgi:ribulose-5-phosphate 4-epimerase/fuculose-1-phosphate aldolase